MVSIALLAKQFDFEYSIALDHQLLALLLNYLPHFIFVNFQVLILKIVFYHVFNLLSFLIIYPYSSFIVI